MRQLIVLVLIGGIAGWAISQGPEAEPAAALVATGSRFFPTAAEQVARFDAGEIPGTRRPTRAEVAALQLDIDDLNESYDELQSERHSALTAFAEAKLDAFLATNSISPLPEGHDGYIGLPPGGIGGRFVVRGEDAYHIPVVAGESALVDGWTQEIDDLVELGNAVILSYFE